MTKYYGLTNKPNEGIKDNAPDWMNSLFEKKMTKTASAQPSHPFEGINDPFLNPSNHGVEKHQGTCELCGVELKPGEVDVCENCSK